MGRSDDDHPFRLCHLLRPDQLRCIGPHPFLVQAALVTGGKTQKVSDLTSSNVVAHAPVLLPSPLAHDV